MVDLKSLVGPKILKELVRFRISPKTVALHPGEQEFLRTIFVPQYYSRQVGLKFRSSERLFGDFLRRGLNLNISPTPLFDNSLFETLTGVSTDRNLPTILRWYREFRDADLTPSVHFDPLFYTATYPDTLNAAVTPYEHYLRHGASEGRRPNLFFDGRWYEMVAKRRDKAEADLPSHLHYIVYGIDRGVPPCAALLPAFSRTRTAQINSPGTVARINAATAKWRDRLGTDQLLLLLKLFHPDTYDGRGELDAGASGVARLQHFLDKGLLHGIDPGPLFSSEHYAALAGVRDTGQGNPLLHFLKVGASERIVPTRLFNEATYKAAWPDIAVEEVWGFAHFIEHGIFEGRSITGEEYRAGHALKPDSVQHQLHNWELFWREAGFERATMSLNPTEQEQTVFPTLKDIDRADLPLIRALFVPAYYAVQAGMPADEPEDSLLGHYLRIGLPRDLPPGPFFDPAVAKSLVGDTKMPVMLAWLQGRRRSWPAPSRLFSKSFYESYYPELAGVSFDLFEHFLFHGLAENRTPNFAFDPQWYSEAYNRTEEEANVPAYLHYILHGARRGLAPSRFLLTTFDVAGEDGLPRLSAFRQICDAGQPWVDKLGAEKTRVMLAMFSPYTYDGGGALAPTTSGAERLLHFLERGAQSGLSPSPLFEEQCYDADRNAGEIPLIDYLRWGWPKRQVPTRLFSEVGYQQAHPDIHAAKIWGFKHFLFHGIYEGRKVSTQPRLTLFAQVGDRAGRELNNVRMFWAANGASSEIMGLPGAVQRTQIRLNNLVSSRTLSNIVKRATDIDPVVGDFRHGEAYHAPPFHDSAYSTIITLMDRIPANNYGTVICVPWLRTGGADLVACQLAQAAALAAPEERVLLLRMDAPNFDRPEWVPEGVDVALISDVLSEVSEATAERLIYALLLTLEPRRVINVNSLRMWRTLERFGSRLIPHADLYAYLFCWDQTVDGLRVGYPSMFYASTAEHLTGLFTDTDYLRLELTRLYGPPEDIARRSFTLHTPSRTEPTPQTFAHLSEQSRAGRRPRVVWAGRLDRQKRFDLVQRIAAKMPEVDFLCWGDPVLDSPPDLTMSPRNLTLRPGFSSYTELPLKESEVFLFTSAWEGMPTILIEAAVRGLSVVASAVGGVPELIDEETGYPVYDIEDVGAYVAEIRRALARPDERLSRAQNLQNRAASRFSLDRYVKDLRAVFQGER